jgi:hypothetical protein
MAAIQMVKVKEVVKRLLLELSALVSFPAWSYT